VEIFEHGWRECRLELDQFSNLQKKTGRMGSPRGRFLIECSSTYMVWMLVPRVSLTSSVPITSVMVAMTIGYHRP
jgi:hypothetical protein